MSFSLEFQDIENLIRSAEQIIADNRSRRKSKRKSSVTPLIKSEIMVSSDELGLNTLNNTPSSSSLSITSSPISPVLSTAPSSSSVSITPSLPVSLNSTIGNRSDDVIFVSSYVPTTCQPEIIDLCSPLVERTSERRTTVPHEYEVSIIDSPQISPKRKCTASSSSNNLNSQLLSSTPKPSTSNSNSAETIIARCPVCLESAVGKRPVSTICGHIFCYDCLNQSMKIMKQCPVCKRKISQKNIHNIFL